MQLIKKITTKFNDIIDHHNLRHHISEKSDRVVLYNAASTISNLVFALIKLTIGIFFLSLWFLIFGGYYIILLAIRSYFLWRYRQIRVSNINPLEREKIEIRYLREGGILYGLLSMALVTLSIYMYIVNEPQRYNQSIVLLIALIGFTKIVTSVVGWIKARHFRSPIITYLKSLNLADGLVAIVMTQYALLSYENSPSASSSTGLFGAAIGIFLIIVGLVITLRAHIKSISR